MKSVLYLFTLGAYIFSGILLISCSSSNNSTPVPQVPSNNSQQQSTSEHQLTSDNSVVLNNPNGNPEFSHYMNVLNEVFGFIITDGWSIIEGDVYPKGDYNNLVESGVLPVIFRNRYTNTDIKNSLDYSPGDLYIEFPSPENPFVKYYIHNGEQDVLFDLEFFKKGETRTAAAVLPPCSTDGRTLFTITPVELNEITGVNRKSQARSNFNLPASDDNRAKMFVNYWVVHKIFQSIGKYSEIPPDTFDGFIARFGRKNPSAWINPYNGNAMEEVPWVKVKTYYWNEAAPDTQAAPQSDEVPKSTDVAGNYSFKIETERDGKRMNYFQFYFIDTDGEVAAYIGW